MMSFRKADYAAQRDDPAKMVSSCSENITNSFKQFHAELLRHCGHPGPIEVADEDIQEV